MHSIETVEIFSAIGTPARLSARTLFLPRYCLDNFTSLRAWPRNKYARERFGPTFRWRLWLLFDCKELEELEVLINSGSDDELWKMRDTQLESFRLVALVVCQEWWDVMVLWCDNVGKGALFASVALQALNLPLITSTSFFVRGYFITAFMLSILATFFTCVQQRAFRGIRTRAELRRWLGVQVVSADGKTVLRSSIAALNLLDMPHELRTIALANLLAGVATYKYLGSGSVYEVKLSAGGALGDVAVIVAFAVVTGFAFALFLVLLGSRRGRRRGARVGSNVVWMRAGWPQEVIW
jgi:hypothetical protein